MNIYDLIIIGGGPAGVNAAIYAARYKLDLLLITKEIGGLAATAHKICNFLSYSEISGFEFMKNMQTQLENLNVPINYDSVSSINIGNNIFIIKTDSGDDIYSRKIIYSIGTIRRKLNVPGEKDFYTKGVSYCATCDGAFYHNKTVAVVGGSDAALTSALLLSEYALKVYLIHRRSEFSRAEPYWIDLVKKEKKVEILYNEEVQEIIGSKYVEKIKLKTSKKLDVDGIFIEIGSDPDTSIINNLNINPKEGYILTDSNQKTNLKGFYAAGDITYGEFKQIITGAAQGAIAAHNIFSELKRESE